MAVDFIPYGRQVIGDEDIAAVGEVLRSDWLTTGPLVERFEQAFATRVDATYAVANSSGTAALHLCMLAAGIHFGDEVIVAALTFVASANCARYLGATIVFADVREDTLTLDVDHVASLITPRTRAIVTVDYGGLPSDLDDLRALADRHGLVLVEDASHSPGAEYRGRKVGSIAHMTSFSFHPVKHLTTGEGGMAVTGDAHLAERLRRFRNHGIDSDHRQRERASTWLYDMSDLGFNYRLNDIQCALGLSQLSRLPQFVERRREIAARYAERLGDSPQLRIPSNPQDRRSSWHLYAIRLTGAHPGEARKKVFDALRTDQIGVNVHYLPVYRHSYYQGLGYKAGLCPVAEHAYEGLLSLPMWAGLTDTAQDRVIASLERALRHV